MANYKLTQSIYASDLKSRAVLVMNYLIYRSNKENTCFPAIKTIARDVHVSVNTVKRALDDLVKAGFVKKEARFVKEKNWAQTSNLYILCEVVEESVEEDAEDVQEGESDCEDEGDITCGKGDVRLGTVEGQVKKDRCFSTGDNMWAAPQANLIPP